MNNSKTTFIFLALFQLLMATVSDISSKDVVVFIGGGIVFALIAIAVKD